MVRSFLEHRGMIFTHSPFLSLIFVPSHPANTGVPSLWELKTHWTNGQIDGWVSETPVLWPPHAESWLIGKYSDAGRDWGQEEKGTTEDKMAGWHHWLDGRESEWTPGVGDGQGALDVLRFMESQRVGHDWVTELYWAELDAQVFPWECLLDWYFTEVTTTAYLIHTAPS